MCFKKFVIIYIHSKLVALIEHLVIYEEHKQIRVKRQYERMITHQDVGHESMLYCHYFPSQNNKVKCARILKNRGTIILPAKLHLLPLISFWWPSQWDFSRWGGSSFPFKNDLIKIYQYILKTQTEYQHKKSDKKFKFFVYFVQQWNFILKKFLFLLVKLDSC